ncbi:MAG: hypothetical protein LRY61_05360 [Burkholderiaceae bacterium]|nr:hypothetical protein [Burkholderiaceae bacterium]
MEDGPMDYDQTGLLAHIREQFRISWHGTHGANHWARVLHHGKHIAAQTGADLLVVELFAFLHDSCREDEYRDPEHGARGGGICAQPERQVFHLTGDRLDTLCFAIRDHSGGDVSTDPTIQTCWDADRLDLWRVGIVPTAPFISDIALDRVDHAYDLSMKTRQLAR